MADREWDRDRMRRWEDEDDEERGFRNRWREGRRGDFDYEDRFGREGDFRRGGYERQWDEGRGDWGEARYGGRGRTGGWGEEQYGMRGQGGRHGYGPQWSEGRGGWDEERSGMRGRGGRRGYERQWGEGRGDWGETRYGGRDEEQSGTRGRSGYGRQWDEGRGGWGEERFGARGRGGWENEEQDFGYGDYMDYDEPTSWTYTEEIWLIPGPFTGIGPRGYQRSDERIKEDICERLSQHGQIDASEVDLEVENGEVTLKGTVNSRREKRMVEDVAESVMGITDVRNELRLKERQQLQQGQQRQPGQHMEQGQTRQQMGQSQQEGQRHEDRENK